MQTVVKLNDKTLEHKDGLIYVDNLNETLDSGIVVCESINRLDIAPLDGIYITFPNALVEKKMVVSSFEEEIASYTPKKYNYTIQYVSPILLFERITLPNLSIKKVYKKNQDEEYLIKEGNYYVRSLLYYVNQYMNEYFTLGDWLVSGAISSKLAKTICPEMSFDRPNLREVLNALFRTIDQIFYIEVVRNNDLDMYMIKGLNPNVNGNTIDTSKLDRDVVRQDVKFYASNLDIELTNSISNKTTKSIQYLTPRTDDAILTTDNAKLIVNEPIYEIEKVELHAGIFEFKDTYNNDVILNWVDISDYVVEKSIYEGLKVEYWTGELNKLNALYYTQGDNQIEGLGKSEKLIGLFDSGAALQNILTSTIFANYDVPASSTNTEQISKVIRNDLVNIMFRITYRTQQDVKMQTEKVIKTKHYSSLFDSQDSKFVNVELFSKNSLNTINKLGNPERTINAVYTNYNDIPKLGDYIDDYVLTTRTISIYDDYVVFEGILTQNFADKYQFNAIDSKKRFYNISDETLVRHELIKKYCVFEKTPLKYEGDDNYLANLILAFQSSKVNYATLKFDYGNNKYSDLLLSEVNTYQEANSVGLTFGFNNNIVVGNARGEKETGGYYQEPIKYVNEYGENYGVEINLYEDMDEKDFTSKTSYLEYVENKSANFPRIETAGNILNNGFYTITSNMHKDQSEIQRWTLQYTFVSNDKDIIIGSGFYENNSFLGGLDITQFKVFTYDKKFNIRNNDILEKNSIIEEYNLTGFNVRGDSYIFELSGNVGIKYNDKLIIGINNYVANTPIYLNIKNNR